jgi:hypothetical protein
MKINWKVKALLLNFLDSRCGEVLKWPDLTIARVFLNKPISKVNQDLCILRKQ